MHEIPTENYERVIIYELSRDIAIWREPGYCAACNLITDTTYVGECMECAARKQYLIRKAQLEAKKSKTTVYGGCPFLITNETANC